MGSPGLSDFSFFNVIEGVITDKDSEPSAPLHILRLTRHPVFFSAVLNEKKIAAFECTAGRERKYGTEVAEQNAGKGAGDFLRGVCCSCFGG